MSDVLETTVDKFTFRVPTDRRYTAEGVWLLEEDGRRFARVGLSDFLQQSSGDVAFAEVRPAGTALAEEDLLATIETIKVTIEIASPIAGTVVEVNPAMAAAPEVINQDPYGGGWLARMEIGDLTGAASRLLEPRDYFARMKGRAEEEVRKR